jgi:hypothetical protein
VLVDEDDTVPDLPSDQRPPVGSERPSLLASRCVLGPRGLQLHHVEPGHRAVLMSVDCVKHMTAGSRVIKHGRAGRPHTVLLQLSEAARAVTWTSRKKSGDESLVRLEWVREVRLGQGSKVFQRYPDPRVAALSLSLIYDRPGRGESTLDLVLEDPNDLVIWARGLQALVEMARNKLLMSAVAEGAVEREVVLQLPLVCGYPSAEHVEDTATGLLLAECLDNEEAADRATASKHESLRRKATHRSLYESYVSLARSSYRDPGRVPRQGSYRLPERTVSALSVSAGLSLPDADDAGEPSDGPRAGANIRVRGAGEIADASWVQQLVSLLPRAGHAYAWACAYRLGTAAAGFEHLLASVAATQRKALDAAGGSRAFGAFLARAASMSVLLVKTTAGDVFGCCATALWERQPGWYGTGESCVFRVDTAHEEVLGVHTGAQAGPGEAEVCPVALHDDIEADLGGAVLAQLHAYRWAGTARCQRFQHTTHQGFGVGGAAEGDDAAEAGAAFFLEKDLRHGQSRPCPTYASPRLSRETIFQVAQLELWVPVPQ